MVSIDRSPVTDVALLGRMPGRWLIWALLAMFFASGISGLIYQVAWLRILGLIYGITVWAVSIVLAGFMAGLALGSFLGGRYADRSPNPLRAYGLLEVGIGVLGLLTPAAFSLLQTAYAGIHGAFFQGQSETQALPFLSLVRMALTFVVLVVPTSMMGATLPVIVKSSLIRTSDLSRNLGLLYATNTFGAVVGTVLAGYWFIGMYGVASTISIAASINIAVGAIALLQSLRTTTLARSQPEDRGVGDVSPTRGTPKPGAEVPSSGAEVRAGEWRRFPLLPVAAVFWAYGLSGFMSFGYEVAWTRVLSLFFDASTYAFTIMLSMVLIGIALGSYAANALTSLFGDRRGPLVFAFAVVQCLIGLTAVFSVQVLSAMYQLVNLLLSFDVLRYLLASEGRLMVVMASLTIFPTTFFLGTTFPLAAYIYVRGFPNVGHRIGSIYAINIVAAIIGSLTTGFFLLPVLGSQTTMLLLAGGNLILAVMLLMATPGLPWRLAFVGALAAIFVVVAMRTPDMYDRVFRGRFPGSEVIWYREQVESTVSVIKAPSGLSTLYINSRGQASDDPHLVSFHQLLGQIPMLVHPTARDVLVVGLGGGATTGAMAQHDGVRIQVVELSEAVVDGARLLGANNFNVVDSPNVHFGFDDGRNYLMLTDRKYDIITADAIRPRDAGSTNLYSVEYYRLALNALKDDGIVVQWVAPFSEYEYKMLVRTFLSAFPYVTLWHNGDVMIGSKQPITVDLEVVSRRFQSLQAREALSRVGMVEPLGLTHWFVSHREEVEAYIGPGPIITDNNPYVEYFRTQPRDEGKPDMSRYTRQLRRVFKSLP